MLKECTVALGDVKVSFDDISERVFVTFKNDRDVEPLSYNLVSTMPGNVLTEVYKAIKLRQSRHLFELRVLRPTDAAEYAVRLGLGTIDDGVYKPTKKYIKRSEYIVLPSVAVKEIRGCVTYVRWSMFFYVFLKFLNNFFYL